MGEILKPPQVARILGVSAQSVREHMKMGLWDLGDYIPAGKRGRDRDEYNIYPAKLKKIIGRELNESTSAYPQEPGNVDVVGQEEV